MLKILHIIDSGGLYGAEVMLLTLAREQQRLGLHPIIASIGEKAIVEKPLEIAAREAGIPVKIFRMAPGLNIRGVRDVLAYRTTENFDLIHSHGYKGNILFGFLPERLRKVPIVATLHGWTSTSGFSKMRLYEWLDAKALSFLDAVIVVNKNMLAHPRFPALSEKKIFTIDNGIPEEFSAKIQLEPDVVEFCRGEFVIGSIGRYSKEKGFDILLHALHLLLRGGGRAKLLIIGDGPCREELHNIAESLGIDENVLFAGYRSHAEAYMKLMDLYVISSLTEGLPITLLEAMRARVPVVATCVGGIPDVLTDKKDALLVPAQDADALAQAFVTVMDDRERAEKRANNAREKFLLKYSSRKMAASYLEVYRKIQAPSTVTEGAA